MIRETKPKLAKYAFEIGLGRDILSYGETFAKIHELVKDIPFKEKGPYWQVIRNSMGTMTVTLYINDEGLYQKIRDIVSWAREFKVGDKVFVYDAEHVYAVYDTWEHIDKVPDFEGGARPTVGPHIITFIGQHSPRSLRTKDLIYVLDNKFMMDPQAFVLI